MLVHKYELFKMEPTESITGMYTRFTNIVNNLKNLGKVYIDADLYRNILRPLPQTWDSKVTAIQQARDLSTLKVEELIGSLITYEINLYQHEKEELKKKKEKGVAFKADIEGASDKNSESVESELSDHEMAFLAKKFRSFMRSKKIHSQEEKNKQEGEQ